MLLCSFDHTECIEGVHHAAIGIHVLGSNICEKQKTAANSQTPLINMLNYVDILVSCVLAVKYFTSCQTGQTLGNTFKVNRVGRPMTSGLSSYGSKVQHLLHVRSGAGDSPPSAHSPAEVNRRYQDIIRSIINWSVKYQTVLIHRPHTLTIMPITLFNLLQATCKWNFLHDPCWSFNPVACGLVLHLAPSSIQTLGIDSHPGSRLPAPKKDSKNILRSPHPSTSLHIPPFGPHLRHVWIQENWVVADHHRVLPQSSLAPSFDSKQQHLSTWKLKKSCRVSCAERQPQLLNCSLEIHLADERKRASYVGEQVHLDVRPTAISWNQEQPSWS